MSPQYQCLNSKSVLPVLQAEYCGTVEGILQYRRQNTLVQPIRTSLKDHPDQSFQL